MPFSFYVPFLDKETYISEKIITKTLGAAVQQSFQMMEKNSWNKRQHTNMMTLMNKI